MRCPLRRLLPWAAILLSATACLAQTADLKNDDLKAIRASLERLVQLTQDLDKNQTALLAVQQMELYELRLQVLENREDLLTDRERELSARTADLQRSFRDTDPSIGPTGVPGKAPDPGVQKAMGEQLETAARLLESTRVKKQQVEREIADLSARLETLQKSLPPPASAR